jgi:hypothetical protein
MTLCKSWLRNGGSPERFLQVWCAEKGFSGTDRVVRELRTLLMALHHAGTYDQVNLGSLICLEVLARRVQGIVDAHSVNAASPNWKLAEFYEGAAGGVDSVSEDLKRFAMRKAKDKWDLDAAALRASGGSTYHGTDYGNAYGGGATAGQAAADKTKTEAAPSGGKDAKSRGRGGKGKDGRGKRNLTAETPP